VTPGDIHRVQLPPANGHEQVGRRPAVILEDDAYASSLPLTIAVPLTAAVAASRFPGTLVVDPTPENGLQKPSVALVFQVRAVDPQKVDGRIGTIGPAVLAQIHALLDRLMRRLSGS
jgi:mRNA interferase MazF